MTRYLLTFFLLSVLYSCNRSTNQQIMNSGTIEYKITYPSKFKNQAFSNILPKEMSVFFTEDHLKFQIKGEFNLFALEFIARSNGDSCFTLFRMPARKIFYPLSDQERWFLFESNPPFSFKEYPDSIKQIAGLNCHKVEVTYKNDSGKHFVAYFTNDISISKELMRSPFEKVEGVPLLFEIQYNNLTYQFEASRFSAGTGNEKLYVPDDYELTEKNEIQSIICSILQ